MVQRETSFEPSFNLDLPHEAHVPKFVFSSADGILGRIANGKFEDVVLYDLHVQAEYFALVREAEYSYSMFGSRAILYPHQVGVVHKVLTDCKHGALLADEVGLGKTIEAGMILKELACRQRAKRVLILAPSTLLTKWAQELGNRFGESCTIYDSKARERLSKSHANIWEANPRIVCSIDTAKQSRYRDGISETDWDLVIVDEAHCLRNASTENYKLVQALRRRVTLLLTATPMQNSIRELYNLVSLVSQVLGPSDSFTMRFMGDSDGFTLKNVDELKRRLGTVMARNLKRDVYLGISQKFVGRVGETLRFALTPEELRLYEEVSLYASGEYLRAMKANDMARGFLLITMQRMVCSSSFAIRDCLKRRIARVQTMLQQNLNPVFPQHSHIDGFATKRSALKRGNNRRLDPRTLHVELQVLERLHNIAAGISINAKGEKLLEAIRRLHDEEPSAKILIFTGFRSTQQYIIDMLLSRGYGVVHLNGSMTREEKDVACASWRDDPGKKIMVSTEVGGEGKDFQFCHILFNFDLPWNPMRVEQRIGRLDRIGQEHTVRIFNLTTIGTVEEHVLDLLDDKIGLFRNVVGEVDLILGDLVRAEGQTFEQIVMRIHSQAVMMEADAESMRFAQLATKIDEAREAFENGIKNIDESVWSKMDLSVWREVMGSEMKQNINDDREKLRRFFLGFLKAHDSGTTSLGNGVFTFHPPDPLRKSGESLGKDIITATFDASAAERDPTLTLIGFGNDMLSEAIDISRNSGFLTKKDVRLRREIVADVLDGTEFLEFIFKVSVNGLASEERIVPVILSLRSGLPQKLPDESLWSGQSNYLGDVTIGADRLTALYNLALEALRARIREWTESVERKCQAQYRKEETAINEYYVESDDAFNQQEQNLKERCDEIVKKKGEAKSYDVIEDLEIDYLRLHNQLQRLRRMNRRKRGELSEAWYRDRMRLRERYGVTIMIDPINAAYIHLSISS